MTNGSPQASIRHVSGAHRNGQHNGSTNTDPNPIRLSPTPESDSEILFPIPAARIREGKQTRIRRKSYGNNGRF